MSESNDHTNDTSRELGRKGAVNSTLQYIIKEILEDEQKEKLLTWLSNSLSATREVIDKRGSSSMLEGFTEGYDITAFKVRESRKILVGDHPEEKLFYLVCVRCNFPVVASMDCICPVCEKNDMLERP